MASYTGAAGNQTISGTAGKDDLTLEGSVRDAEFSIDDSGRWVVTTPAGGEDTLVNIETVRFEDSQVRLAPAGTDSLGNPLPPALTGTALGDVLDASGSDNAVRLVGGFGDDRLLGGFRADQLVGGVGSDTLEGGYGNDTYYLDGADSIVDVSGVDTAISADSFSLDDDIEHGELSGSADANLQGNASDNRLTGNAGANVLDGGEGSDTLTGGAGNDTYIVNDGDTVVEAGNEGLDAVFSSVSFTLSAAVENLYLTGVDRINGTGNDLDNLLVGNDAANGFDGRGGNDTMIGGGGDDTYVVSGIDAIIEQAGDGNDTVLSAQNWTLDDNLEELLLTGAAHVNATGNDLGNWLVGNSGNNVLDGGAGADTMEGGDGNDTYIVDSALDQVNDYGTGGLDQVRAWGSHALGVGVENLTLLGTDRINGSGNSQANVIRGNGAANVLDGGWGDDLLYGGAGDDTLDGSLGLDTLAGGIGDDLYVVDGSAADVRELAGQGTDTVWATVATGYSLDAQVENLVLIGRDVFGIGNDLANRLIGSDGSNVLNGGAGADTLIGGEGSDRYVIDRAGDQVIERKGAGRDEVIASVSVVLAQNVENGILTGSATLQLTGQGEDNRLIGNGGANVLRGLAGNDTLVGRSGSDKLYGGDGNDLLDGVIGNDLLDGGAGNDIADYRTAGAGVSVNLALTSLLATGGAGSDTLVNIESVAGSLLHGDDLRGTAGNNALAGYGGDDTLAGGGGNDRLTGGEGDDLLVDGVGNSVLDGGNGFDTLSYLGVAGSVSVNLEELAGQQTGAAGIDRIRNIEALIGSDEGDDVLTGDALDNLLRGAGGGDTLAGGAGDDTLYGGNGLDVASYQDSVFAVRVDLRTSAVQDTGGAGRDLLSGIEGVIGSGWGNDSLTGDAGANYLDGSGGADTMAGGAGGDSYVVDSTNDVIVETASIAGEIDRVWSSVSLALGDELEYLTLTGTEAINGIGNARNNLLVGNAGSNALAGGAGNDTLVGGDGGDVLTGGAGNDAFRFATSLASAGVDTLKDFDGAGDRIELDNAVFTRVGATGRLASSAFHVGAAATDTADRIVYNDGTGRLYYDADGSGAGAQVLIATLTGVPPLTSADIFVI